MKNLSLIVALAAGSFLLGLYANDYLVSGKEKQKTKHFTIERYEDKTVAEHAERALPLIIKACPGLERYAEDLHQVIVAAPTLINPLYNKGAVIEFKVADPPKKLPRPLNVRSGGHNCYIDISNLTDRMYIAKRACHSICPGTWTENDPGSMGREFNLVN